MARARNKIVVSAAAGLLMATCQPLSTAAQAAEQKATAGAATVLVPLAHGRSKKSRAHGASQPPRWFADFMQCSAYRSVQLLCARAVERTDNAEKNLLACLEQEGFIEEPKQCKPTPH
jgi:hypothetical protein